MKTRIACNYAIVRFLPYPEAGEFVNIGVIVHNPTGGFFDYLLETKRTKRVGGFFPELEMGVYRDAIKNCENELKRMRNEVGINGGNAAQMTLDPETGIAFFKELVRPRETVIRFGKAGTALTTDPTKLLQDLFEHYVLRMFATEPEYQEEVMQRRVMETLRAHRLITKFRPAQIGNEDYHVTFPFVYEPKIGLFARAIKPLNLGQDDSTKIYDHGELWVNRIRRLQRMNVAPEKILLPVHGPDAGNKRRRAAYKEVVQELKRVKAIVVPEGDEDAILRFAGEVEPGGSE
jgi:DUF3037 family protein